MSGPAITEEQIVALPEPVRRYMQYTGVIGKPRIKTARVEQGGRFRLGAGRSWMDFSAEQLYTTSPPSFSWDAKFKVLGLPALRAEDTYKDGRGHMFGRLLGVKTIFDARGPELDQGSMLRYLNEVMWFPTAYLRENMRWQAVDDESARVTFSDHGREVTADLYFDSQGRLVDFKAKRYREVDGEFLLDDWSTPIRSYGEYEGLNLPSGGTGVWHLPDGDFAYIQLEIMGIEYEWQE